MSTPSLLVVAFAIGAYHRHERHRAERGLTAFLTRNPALFAGLAGLLAPDAVAPGWAVDGSRALVVLMAPIGFFALGVFAAGSAVSARRFAPRASVPVVAASALKLCVPVAVVFACSRALHDVPDAYLVQAAMPTGINTLLLVSAYKLDRELIVGTLIYTTAAVLTWGTLAAVVG